ncbi:MAG: SCP2 sterol-binding domain-containing protein [Promethearchaeota archaeon]
MVKFAELKEEGINWANSFCKALNESKAYEEAGKGWKGALLLNMKACGEVEDDVKAFVDVEDGKCRGITVLGPGEDPPAEPVMTITGTMFVWRQLAFQERDPIQALMTGVLELDGDMSLAMRYSRAALELAKTAENTDTTLLTKYDLGSGDE